MARMFTPEPLSPEAKATPREDENPSEAVLDLTEKAAPEEFEYVLGRRQVASISLVILTGIAGFAALAYIVGKSSAKTISDKTMTEKVVMVQAAPAAQPAGPPVSPAPPKFDPLQDAPLAGTPEKGRIYIQLASVERGYAILMVYGARKLGFPSFIAPGASSAVYRVLCGPFADEEAYKEAKQTFANAGLDTFSRKYTEPAESPRPASSSCQRA